MKRFMLAGLLALSTAACGQNTTVSATVTDTDGQAWINGTWTAVLALPGGAFRPAPTIGGAAVVTTVKGALDANGAFSATLTRTDALDQQGGQWTITACPNASVPQQFPSGCYAVTTTLASSTLNLSPSFASVPAPRFPAGPSAFGYQDVEVLQPVLPGSTYYNTAMQSVRMWNGSSWAGSSGGVTSLTGDVAASGNGSVTATVQGLRGHTLSCSSLGAGYVPVSKDGTTFTCAQLTLDQIGPAFAINSFTCSTCGTYEIGATIASPTNFTATYSSAATSGTVSDGTHSVTLTPANATSQSGSLAYSYTSSSAGAMTFTLTSIGATTKNASQSITWAPRTFGGVGTAGATGATASGTTAVLSGATGTLQSAGGLYNQGAYGPYSPSGQKVYLLMTGSGHTFKDQNGFTFSMNAPTAVSFVNQNGATVAMYLYESTNVLSATYTISVVN